MRCIVCKHGETEPGVTLLRWMRTLAVARLVCFDPVALRKPSGLPEVQSGDLMDEHGFGLAGVYFALRSLGDDAFPSIMGDVRRCFKAAQELNVKAVTPSTVALEVELRNGARVSAERMSKGLLFFSCICCAPEPPANISAPCRGAGEWFSPRADP